MRTATHKASGLVLVGLIYGAATYRYGEILPLWSQWAAGHIAVGALLGCTAPDWMEVPKWDEQNQRSSLIPHRQITHWMLGWALLLFYAWHEATKASGFAMVAWYWLMGFAMGGLLHVAMDYSTPMGVPVVWPWVRRRRFGR